VAATLGETVMPEYLMPKHDHGGLGNMTLQRVDNVLIVVDAGCRSS
jgi:hypothetical protein